MEVLWLDHADCHAIDRAGAKAAHLSRLASSYRVPAGFCIAVEAYSRWAELIASDRPASPTPGIPLALADALASAYQDLADMCGVTDPSVAVRSSAVDEDGLTHSFAGQYETYLNISGAHAVAEAVVRCWTSVRTARALAYRQWQGSSVTGARLAVLVQQLVPADASAVVFSVNPLTGSGDEVMINASWGIGESLVSGTVTPDTYIVRKSDLALGFRMTTALLATNFPIPLEVKGFWAWEKGHFPRPATPLTQELLYSALSEGFSAAMERWACPFGAQCRAINYYGFFTIKPFDLGAETMQERVARYQEHLGQVLPRMGELWERTWLPAILPGLEKARTTDYTALNVDELLHTLDEMRRDFLERWTIHGWINFVTISASWFADFYNNTFEPEDPTEPYLLLEQ